MPAGTRAGGGMPGPVDDTQELTRLWQTGWSFHERDDAVRRRQEREDSEEDARATSAACT